jgi:S-DNA-T family DNA segregation ATPase FtsK/SpoIIIE
VGRLSRRRRTRSALKTNLKYEIYGLLIIIFAVISLAGKDAVPGVGSVGRSLSYIFFFLAGKFYFVLPLAAIYAGMYVMIKRKWPRAWSYRKTGIVLLVVAVLIYQHIELFERLEPGEEHSSWRIMTQPYENLSEYLTQTKDVNAFKAGLGGGLIGAILYGMLHFLFDRMGSQFIVFTLFVIAFMCITGLSLADIVQKIRGRRPNFSSVRFRLAELARLLRQKRRKQPSLLADDGDDEQFGEPRVRPPKNAVRFFPWFPAKKNSPPPEADWDEPSAANGRMSEMADDDENGVIAYDEEDRKQAAEVVYRHDEDDPVPVIRDFQEHDEDWHSFAGGEEAAREPAEPAHDAAQAEDLPQSKVESAKPDRPAQRADHLQSAEGKGSGRPAGDGNKSGQPKTNASAQPEKPYILPHLQLLSPPENSDQPANHTNYKANARKLEATLESFGVRTKVLEVVRGPAVTRYEIQPDIGVKVSRIVSLTDDIALALAAKDIRMEAPIPGKSAIGIEVPNSEVSIVTMREVMESSAFQKSASKLTIALGRDISGQPIVANLAKMPHLLVAGATGSGKSVCINGIIVSILYKAKPDEVKFLMVDPKKVELNNYNGIPHLLAPVVTDPRRASLALKKVVAEMEQRYEQFSKTGTRNIEGYNEWAEKHHKERLPYIVVIVDELADLMMVAAGDVEDSITRLAQMARAAGIHLILATQRPSVNVITGVIKANIPSRIAFGVSSQVDSRTILDSAGAEKLLGRGDMLFLPVGANKPIRIQGCFLSDQEVEKVVHFVKNQREAEYREELVPEIDSMNEAHEDGVEDELFDQAVQIVVEAKQASVSLLQRRMRIGYTRAARLIDAMEAKGIVGAYEGSKPREVLITWEQYQAQTGSDPVR